LYSTQDRYLGTSTSHTHFLCAQVLTIWIGEELLIRKGNSKQAQGYHLGRIIFRIKERNSKQTQDSTVQLNKEGFSKQNQVLILPSKERTPSSFERLTAGWPSSQRNTNPFVLLLNYLFFVCVLSTFIVCINKLIVVLLFHSDKSSDTIQQEAKIWSQMATKEWWIQRIKDTSGPKYTEHWTHIPKYQLARFKALAEID
jgi:hypothetical protein